MKDLTKNRWKFMIIPLLIIVAGIAMFFVHGFNFDVDFMGGVRMQVETKTEFNNNDMAALLKDKMGIDATIQKGSSNTIAVIKTSPVEDAEKAETFTTDLFNTIHEQYTEAELVSVSSASASFGLNTQSKALLFTIIAIICILIYIAIRFEWRSAVMAVVALTINVLIMIAVYLITNIPLNTTFIAAMLTVVGYSINNTIVIFDRIRENMKARKKNETVSALVNRSVFETMGRTINSTITTLITIVLIYILGVSTIRDFALPLIVGIIAGAYTSIFIASTFWAAWRESNMKAKAAAAQERKSNKKNK